MRGEVCGCGCTKHRMIGFCGAQNRSKVMRRIAISFGISLAIVGLAIAATKISLFAGILVAPGLILSSHLIPKSAWPGPCSDFPPIECIGGSPAWMYFYLVCGIVGAVGYFEFPARPLKNTQTPTNINAAEKSTPSKGDSFRDSDRMKRPTHTKKVPINRAP